RRGAIEVIAARHEQGAVHAADGYARATGRLGVAIVSTGPGTANAMNGLYEAAFASSPVLLITTQVDTCHLGKNRGFIHDAPRQLEMLRTVTRRAEQVRRAEEISSTLHRVIYDIQQGRPQPGAVEIPVDLQLEQFAASEICYRAPAPIAPSAAAVEQAVERIQATERPLIWVGGGTVDAADEVRELVDTLGAPVVSTVNGRGVVPPEHPHYLGCHTHFPEFPEFLAQADLVLAIGTRFQSLASQNWTLPMPRQLVHLDVDPGVI